MGVDVLDRAHNIALVVGGEAEVFPDSAGDADALLMAIVHIEGTMAGRLVGVEITLNQEAGHAMLEHAQIAGVSDAGIGVNTGR